MPDWDDSTRLPISQAQEALAGLADELRQLDERLRTLTAAIVPESGDIVAADLRGGLETVCGDLLCDAIVSLSALATLTVDDARRRRVELADAANQIAASN